MFWGSFTYDMKGPCHIWDDETEAEKKASQAELDALNRDNEAKCRQEWEVTTGMRRLALKNLPGKRPQWKFTKKTGKLVSDVKKRNGFNTVSYGTETYRLCGFIWYSFRCFRPFQLAKSVAAAKIRCKAANNRDCDLRLS